MKAKENKKEQSLIVKRIKRNKTAYFMMAPYFILFYVFTVIPVLASMGLSFTSFNMLEMPKFIGWDNFLKLFIDDNIFIIALKNTLIFAVIT